MEPLKLIVGLGNPGQQYERTRHNVGAVWVQTLAEASGIALVEDRKFKGKIGRGTVAGHDLRLVIPTTFMNLSGDSVGAIQRFYKLTTASILVAYDEMAFEPGIVRLKQGGGDNGHNGIRSVRAGCGNDAEFHRVRIGVGHPGDRSRVTAFLTQIKMPDMERSLVEAAMQIPSEILADMVNGDWQAAMNALHANPGS